MTDEIKQLIDKLIDENKTDDEIAQALTDAGYDLDNLDNDIASSNTENDALTEKESILEDVLTAGTDEEIARDVEDLNTLTGIHEPEEDNITPEDLIAFIEQLPEDQRTKLLSHFNEQQPATTPQEYLQQREQVLGTESVAPNALAKLISDLRF